MAYCHIKMAYWDIAIVVSQEGSSISFLCRHTESVEAADNYFVDQVGIFEAMHVVWTHLSEEDRHNVCALFDNCTDDCKFLLNKFALLGCAPMNDIDKLRGCYFVTKEDPSVSLNPILQLPHLKPKSQQQVQCIKQ
jgi:hypothetical protein